MRAYYDFFTGASSNFTTARSIVREYEEHPVQQWRLLFLEMLYQLNELDGEEDEDLELDANKMNEAQQKANKKKSVKAEVVLQAELKDNVISVETQNINQVLLKFYLIDVEILFSRAPFLTGSTSEFSYVKPFSVLEKEVPDSQAGQHRHLDIPIPEELRVKNLVIEVNGAGKQILLSYYSAELKVILIESFGELKVCDKNDKPVPQVYVKVFAQNHGNSTPVFFKDGYTDMRGKFEYA
mmetsp:Transcript_22200/g.16599  ORF Transcript_22200/g.16599 Transcript_22200/m.16599 type:complete len:239 (+) Transcript_22200:130-846(+)